MASKLGSQQLAPADKTSHQEIGIMDRLLEEIRGGKFRRGQSETQDSNKEE
jgi:hypothetical protein